MKLFDLHSLIKIIIYFRVWVTIKCSGPSHFLPHLAVNVKVKMPRPKGFKSSFTKCYLVPEWLYESLKRCLQDSHDEKSLHDLNKKPASTLQGLKPENRKRVVAANEEIPLPDPKRAKMDNFDDPLIASSPEGNSSPDPDDEESAAEDDAVPSVPPVPPTKSFARKEAVPAKAKQVKKRFEGPDISDYRKCIHCQGMFPSFSALTFHQKTHHPDAVKPPKNVKSLPKTTKALPKPPPTNDKQRKPRSKSESITEEKKQPAQGKKRPYESEQSDDNSDDMFDDDDDVDATRDRASSKRFAFPSKVDSDDEEMRGGQKGSGKPKPKTKVSKPKTKVSKPLSFKRWL